VTGRIEDEANIKLEPGKHFFQLTVEFDCTQPGISDKLPVVVEVTEERACEGGVFSDDFVFIDYPSQTTAGAGFFRCRPCL